MSNFDSTTVPEAPKATMTFEEYEKENAADAEILETMDNAGTEALADAA